MLPLVGAVGTVPILGVFLFAYCYMTKKKRGWRFWPCNAHRETILMLAAAKTAPLLGDQVGASGPSGKCGIAFFLPVELICLCVSVTDSRWTFHQGQRS